MDKVVDFLVSKDRIRARRNRQLDPAIAEIVLALLALKGSAHREVVVDTVINARSGSSTKATAAERQELFAAFDAYLAGERPRSSAPLVHLPFGEGSHRGALTPLSLAALRDLRGHTLG
jgi:hypothetical protein